MKTTKKQLADAFLLFLDDALPSFECEKIEKEGNWRCNRCDLCMMEQYIKKAKAGELPKVARENGGRDYPFTSAPSSAASPDTPASAPR